ncbi:MAG: RNA polymerase sigma factor [Chloroflexi bacterium]|nr:RNA polymerase sigma factor [Chloroflexota bacterium]
MHWPGAFHEQTSKSDQTGGTVSELALAIPLPGAGPVDGATAEECEWVQRARQGDLEAFDLIMGRYETKLLRFLTGLVSDVEVARELCQDTFLAAYQALPRLSGEVRLSAWLHTIALNRARSYHRKRRLRAFLPLEDHHVAAPGLDLQESVAFHDAVRRTLARMPKPYVTALLLQTASGLSCREIAEVVGCSESAVKVRLMRARDTFRRLYRLEEREPCGP